MRAGGQEGEPAAAAARQDAARPIPTASQPQPPLPEAPVPPTPPTPPTADRRSLAPVPDRAPARPPAPSPRGVSRAGANRPRDRSRKCHAALLRRRAVGRRRRHAARRRLAAADSSGGDEHRRRLLPGADRGAQGRGAGEGARPAAREALRRAGRRALRCPGRDLPGAPGKVCGAGGRGGGRTQAGAFRRRQVVDRLRGRRRRGCGARALAPRQKLPRRRSDFRARSFRGLRRALGGAALSRPPGGLPERPRPAESGERAADRAVPARRRAARARSGRLPGARGAQGAGDRRSQLHLAQPRRVRRRGLRSLRHAALPGLRRDGRRASAVGSRGRAHRGRDPALRRTADRRALQRDLRRPYRERRGDLPAQAGRLPARRAVHRSGRGDAPRRLTSGRVGCRGYSSSARWRGPLGELDAHPGSSVHWSGWPTPPASRRPRITWHRSSAAKCSAFSARCSTSPPMRGSSCAPRSSAIWSRIHRRSGTQEDRRLAAFLVQSAMLAPPATDGGSLPAERG